MPPVPSEPDMQTSEAEAMDEWQRFLFFQEQSALMHLNNQKRRKQLEQIVVQKQERQREDAIRNAVREGVMMIANGIVRLIPIAAPAVGFVVSFIPHLALLADKNIRVVNYYREQKGARDISTMLFPGLGWQPIPMPNIVPVSVRHISIWMETLLVIAAGLVVSVLAMLLMMVVLALTVGPAVLLPMYVSNSAFRSFVNTQMSSAFSAL